MKPNRWIKIYGTKLFLTGSKSQPIVLTKREAIRGRVRGKRYKLRKVI